MDQDYPCFNALDEAEAEEFKDILRQQIHTLKLLRCANRADEEEVTEASEEDDDELEADGDSMKEVVDRKQIREMRPADIVKARIFDAHYHYRRVNKVCERYFLRFRVVDIRNIV
jgi:hypothetical protein